jgi:hypothetical protein
MEEGFKFIIPPPKYHPFPNLLPLLDPIFLLDKMAADHPYHRLPEDNRPSMDSLPGDDQRLLDTDPVDDDPAPPKKCYSLKFSYHPTAWIRLLVLCLYICAFVIFIVSRHGRAIPAVVFLALAILRNIHVLYSHLIGHSPIRIHVEIVGQKPATRASKPKAKRRYRLKQQLAIDWFLIICLIVTSCIARIGSRRYGWYPYLPDLIIPGCIICWIAM